MPPRRFLLAILAWLGVTGCVRQLTIDDTAPTSTISYSGVSGEARQFADYGSIDARILGRRGDVER
jgi:hypothetical protein